MSTIDKITEAKLRLDEAIASAEREIEHQTLTPPYSVGIGFYDGVFAAIEDSQGIRVVDLRDIEGAATLVRSLNLSAGFR